MMSITFPEVWDTNELSNADQKTIPNNQKSKWINNSRFHRSAGPQNKNENKLKDRQTEPGQRTKNKLWNECNIDLNSSWCTSNCPQMFDKETGKIGKQKYGNHPDYSIAEIGHNTKSQRNLKWLAFTQTSLKNHQRELMWKTPVNVRDSCGDRWNNWLHNKQI